MTLRIEFANGEVTIFMAIAITKTMCAQCDLDGNKCIVLDELIGIKRTDNACTLDQKKITVNSTSHQHMSTMGWFICCRWKGGSTTLEKLPDLRKSHPVQVAEFAIWMKIVLEPSINLCVPWHQDTEPFHFTS